MVIPKADREGLHTLRTLETLSEHLHSFQTRYEGNLKNAKHAFNVISRIFFNIPLEQVCIPGLHITLGVYVKLLEHFEYFCKDLDCQIAHLLAQSDEEAIGNEFNAFVDILKEIREVEKNISDLNERHEIIIAELNWFAISQSDCFDEEFHTKLLKQVDEKLLISQTQLERLKNDNKLGDDVGPCQSSIDKTLKGIGVERPAYFGGCLVGNHCDKMLEDENIEKLSSSIPSIVLGHVDNAANLHDTATHRCNTFAELFRKYARCLQVFNSANPLDKIMINTLEDNTRSFMTFLRSDFPDIKISPKLHMMEDHVIPFIRRWGAACGFYGEQGGESIHQTINNMKRNYNCMPKGLERLKYIMVNHLTATNPNAAAKRVPEKKRNLRRNIVD